MELLNRKTWEFSNRGLRIFLIFVLFFGLFSCKARKRKKKFKNAQTIQISTQAQGKDTSIVISDSAYLPLPGDPLQRQQWQYYSANGKAEYTSEKQAFDFKISLRMRKDSIIWFSAKLEGIGIEVAKGIITNDSAVVLIIPEQSYLKLYPENYQELMGAKFTVTELQNAILANPIFEQVNYIKSTAANQFFAEKGNYSNMIIANNLNRPDTSLLQDKDQKGQVQIIYQDTIGTPTFVSPATLLLKAIGQKAGAELNLYIKRISDAPIHFAFKIPENFSQAEWKGKK